MADIRNVPGVPDFTGDPTEQKRIDNQGWADKDKPTNGAAPPLPMPSADPDSH